MSATTPLQAPPIPVTLRAIAAWLESHPCAYVDSINFIGLPGEDPIKVSHYPDGRDAQINAAIAIGGDWEHQGTSLVQQIAPGIEYHLFIGGGGG